MAEVINNANGALTEEQKQALLSLLADDIAAAKTTTSANTVGVHDYKVLAAGYDWVEGARNETMHRYLSSLQARGFADDEIRAAAKYVYDNVIPDVSGYTEAEVDKTLAVVLAYPKGKRRLSVKSIMQMAGDDIDAANDKLQEEYPYAVIVKSGESYGVRIDANALADYIIAHNDYRVVGDGDGATVWWFTGNVYAPKTKNEVRGYIKQLMQQVDTTAGNVKIIEDVYKLLLIESSRQARWEDFNSIPAAINFRNGVLFAFPKGSVWRQTGVLRMTTAKNLDGTLKDIMVYDFAALREELAKSNAEYLPTYSLPVDYRPDAKIGSVELSAFCSAQSVPDGCGCPVFLQYLNDLAGMPEPLPDAEALNAELGDLLSVDVELTECFRLNAPPENDGDGINTVEDAAAIKRLLLLWVGLIISGYPVYATKRLLMLVGSGNTGKSQFIRLLVGLVGAQNAAAIPLQALTSNRFALAPAQGKRLIYDPDVRAMRMDDISVLKQLTGGDGITYERKGKDPITAVYDGGVVLAANQLPVFGGDRGKHVYERFVVIPCNNVIPANRRDPEIVDKMLAEAPAIIQLALAALQEQLAVGLNHIQLPEPCKKAIHEYEGENDNAVEFLRSCTERRTAEPLPDDKETARVVYSAYCEWARAEGVYVQPLPAFRQAAKLVYGDKIYADVVAKKANARYFCFGLTAAYRRFIQQEALAQQAGGGSRYAAR